MKFCLIKDIKSGEFLGNEWEEPYSYSEYTSGGGFFNLGFGNLSSLFKAPVCYGEIDFVVSIFENEKKAQEFINAHLDHYTSREFKVIKLMDLEKEER